MSDMEPIPVGTVVDYTGSLKHGRYMIIDHAPPVVPAGFDPDEYYPDGVAYVLWPVGVPEKFGFRHLSVTNARRKSITEVTPG